MHSDVADRLDAAAAPPGGAHRQAWSVVAALLMADVFLEAVFAGAMLSGAPWANQAHAANAVLLLAACALAGLIALATLRRAAGGRTLGLTLLALAAAVFAQMALGAMSRHGANLLWAHVPLGVALVGFAGQAVVAARRLS